MSYSHLAIDDDRFAANVEDFVNLRGVDGGGIFLAGYAGRGNESRLALLVELGSGDLLSFERESQVKSSLIGAVG